MSDSPVVRTLGLGKRYGASWALRDCTLEIAPGSVTALFNLGVALEDLRMPEEAVLAYRTALAADPGCADAHYNLAHLYERRGEPAAALRHLRTYRKLVQA